MLAAPLTGVAAPLAVHIPYLVAVVAQIVLVVLLQLLEAGLGHIHQLDAGLHRRGARLVALGDVLLARARGLLHLVHRAVANLRQVMLQEVAGDVVDALRLLEGDEFLVVALGGVRKLLLSVGIEVRMRIMGTMGTMGIYKREARVRGSGERNLEEVSKQIVLHR